MKKKPKHKSTTRSRKPTQGRGKPTSPKISSSSSLANIKKQTLIQNSQHLEGIVRSAMDGIIMIDEDHKVTLFNGAAERMFGWSESEMLGQSINRLIPERFQSHHHDHVDKFGITNSTSRSMGNLGEIFGIRSNGEEFPLEATISQSVVEGERVFAVILRDITQRKEKNEQEQRLGRIFEDSRNEIYVFDEQTLKCIQVNRGARENLGYSLEELEDMTPLDIEPDMTGESFTELLQPLRMNKQEKVRFQTVHRRKDLSRYPVDVHIQLSTWGQRKIFVAMILDLTEQQRTQQTLQDERDFSKAVLDTAGALVVVLNVEGRIVNFNRACEQITGYTVDEVKGKHVWDFLLVPQEENSVKAIFERLRDKGISNQFENDWVAKDGSYRRITWSNTALLDSKGWVKNIIATGIDITEFRQMQEDLRHAERLAELGTLASGMAHEIGTPMNVILGRAEHLLSKTEEGGTRKGLQTIVSQVERITKIMNQLLAFARRRKGEYHPIDLQKIIEENLEVLIERLDRSGIKVKPSFYERGFRINGDPDHMTQVFLNLFINAIHAMPEGGTLQVELKQENENGTITVSDTGYGIPAENLSKVFLPFFSTKKTGMGTGLGLSVVKDILQEHGGAITVNSEPGKGTTFTITLPICPP